MTFSRLQALRFVLSSISHRFDVVCFPYIAIMKKTFIYNKLQFCALIYALIIGWTTAANNKNHPQAERWYKGAFYC